MDDAAIAQVRVQLSLKVLEILQLYIYDKKTVNI